MSEKKPHLTICRPNHLASTELFIPGKKFVNVLNVAIENNCELPRIIRIPLWQVGYKLQISYDAKGTVNFMNAGNKGLRVK